MLTVKTENKIDLSMGQCVSLGRHLHNHQMLMFVCAMISSILAHELTSRPLTVVAEPWGVYKCSTVLLLTPSPPPLSQCPQDNGPIQASVHSWHGQGRGQ